MIGTSASDLMFNLRDDYGTLKERAELVSSATGEDVEEILEDYDRRL